MIPFIDLKSQQDKIRPQIEARFCDIMDGCQFIMGPEVAELEEQLSHFCGAKHTLSCSNGTDALILALMLKGVGPGDAVILPAFTFGATAEAVAILGASPVFADVLQDTFNIDPESVEKAIAVARDQGLKPKGIIAVGLFGQPAGMDRLLQITSELGLWLLDDAAQSFGGTYKGTPVGTLADVSTTSFFPAKPLGCYGDGGAVFTNSDQDIETLRSMRVHGQGKDKYENIRLGMTGRLDTLQAAVLLEKLKIFPEEIKHRQKIAERYNAELEGVCQVPQVLADCQSIWAIYTVKVPPEVRASLMEHLKGRGVPSGIYYSIPLHLQKAYAHYPRAAESLPVCEALSHEVLSLPIHAYLQEDVQDHIITVFREGVHKAQKSAA